MLYHFKVDRTVGVEAVDDMQQMTEMLCLIDIGKLIFQRKAFKLRFHLHRCVGGVSCISRISVMKRNGEIV